MHLQLSLEITWYSTRKTITDAGPSHDRCMPPSNLHTSLHLTIEPVRYRIVRLATALKDAAVPWVDSRMRDLWRDIKAARSLDLDDGSGLKTNGSSAFLAFYAAELADAVARSDEKKKEILKEKKALFDALAGGLPATFDADVANDCHKKWFAEIMKHHHKPALSKTKNSDMRCWADKDGGHVHVAKLFCNGLGLGALKKLSLADVDVEAIARIIETTLVYFTDAQKKTAHQFCAARNICFHAPKPELSSDQFTMLGDHLKGFEAELVAVGALPRTVSTEYLFGEVDIGDDHYAQLVRSYNELKTVRNSLLTSILNHLLPSSGELLRPSEEKCSSLRGFWAVGSRLALTNELARLVSECPNGAVHVHGCHGSGKSSLMANFSKEALFDAPGPIRDAVGGSTAVLFLRHFFIRNDAASSVQIAVLLACLCNYERIVLLHVDSPLFCRSPLFAFNYGPKHFSL